MADLQQDNPASDAWRFNPRVFPRQGVALPPGAGPCDLGYCVYEFRQEPHYSVLDRSGAVHRARLCRHAVARRRKPRAALASDLDAGTALGRGARGHASHVRGRRQPDGNLEQYSLSAISALAERAVAALVPR